MARRSHRPNLYYSWVGMRRNCRKSRYLVGISVCPEWASSYGAYEKWCMDNGWSPGMMVARIDKGNDYGPDNCKVVSMTEFNGMRRCVRRMEDGRTVREATGVAFEKDRVLAARVSRRILEAGWDVESALSVPRMSPSESVYIGFAYRGVEKKRSRS